MKLETYNIHNDIYIINTSHMQHSRHLDGCFLNLQNNASDYFHCFLSFDRFKLLMDW